MPTKTGDMSKKERAVKNAEEMCKKANEIFALKQENKRLQLGHDRYETARRLNPMQWQAAWELNLTTGKPFDEIIDNMRPFMMSNVKVRGAEPRFSAERPS